MSAALETSWMRWTLAGAAVSSIAAGALMIASPASLFAMADLEKPRYPEVLQVLGVVVGSYGLAYALAARDPRRHWPIVLSGLVAKLLAPILFVYAAANGRLPWSAGWTILIADVMWWAPFGLILRQTWTTAQHAKRIAVPEVLRLALRARTDSGLTLEQMSFKWPVLVVFLRHAGCTFCREALTDLAKQRDSIEATGTAIVLVHMGESNFGREFFRKYHLDDIPQISDPRCLLYKAFGLAKGSLQALFGLTVWWRGLRAGVVEGHGVGPLAGDGLQMPGLFLLYHGEVIQCYRHQSAADRPDYLSFVRQERLSRMAP